MEALEEEAYADLIRPENEVNQRKSPPLLSRKPAMSSRRYRLSLSPLDSLQAKFKKYNDTEQMEDLRLSQSTNHQLHSLPENSAPERFVNRRQARASALPSNSSIFTSLEDVEELSDSITDTADWDFILRNSGVVDHPRNSDCPSLTTGSTLSSRNSSTRSTRSFKWDVLEYPEKTECPYPECGRVFRDLPAHLLTHQAERPEKCPLQSCEYHIKGFARPYDRARHTISHFKQTMICGFCPTEASTGEKTFNRCDVFLKHLVTTHDVEQTSAGRRDDVCNTAFKSHGAPTGQRIATCELCSEPFDAQGFYEHLRGCTLRQVTRNCTTDQTEENGMKPEVIRQKNHTECDTVPTSSYAPLQFPRTPEHLYASLQRPQSELASVVTSTSSVALELQYLDSQIEEIAELTASSRCLSLTSSQDDAAKSSDEETDWTEDTGSPDSLADAESLRPMLCPMKQHMVDRLMQEFNRIFDKMIRTHNGAGATRSAGSGSYTSSSGSSTYSSSSFVSRKRSLSGGSTPPPDDNGDDSNKRRKPHPDDGLMKQNTPELRFACPYYKRNPGRHQTFTSCRDPGFMTVARLKEHLYRRHLLPIQCNRCCSTFANEPMLREHQRDPKGCDIKDQVPLEGFDKDQERKLKSKKRALVYQSEEDKWKGVYRILFPDDNDTDMPSPYIEYQPCTNGGVTAENSNVARFQEFTRLELPRLVRRTLEVTVEEEAQPLEDRLKERLVDIVRECQTQLITIFQSTIQEARNTRPLSLSQLQLSATESTAQPPQVVQMASNYATHNSEILPTAAAPFCNFDSFHTSSATDFIPIPIHYPEHDNLITKNEASPPVEHGSNTPDSGYDSNWNIASQAQEAYLQSHGTFTQTLPFTPAPSIPHQQGQAQPMFNSAPMFMEPDHVDLGGYYGLFESREAGFTAGMVDPSWTYLDNTNGNGGDNLMRQSHGHGGGAVM